MWNFDYFHVDSIKDFYPRYQFKKLKKTKNLNTIVLPNILKIDFSILKSHRKSSSTQTEETYLKGNFLLPSKNNRTYSGVTKGEIMERYPQKNEENLGVVRYSSKNLLILIKPYLSLVYESIDIL